MSQLQQISTPPAHLRSAYLDSLIEPQELHLELQVAGGTPWTLDDKAYAVERGKLRVEFYIVPQEANRLLEIFAAAMTESKVSGVLCKSFDTQMLCAALSQPAAVRPIGLLFRRIADPAFVTREDVALRPGTMDDANAVFSFNDGFFESLDEIRSYVTLDGLFVLEKGEAIVGCGISRRVIDNRADVDIGMLVARAHRRQGYGSHIIAFLKRHCLSQNLRPICGCSVENIGSQRAVHKAGFVSEHRLLEITYLAISAASDRIESRYHRTLSIPE